MFDLISEIRQTLGQNKMRTALTGVAVSWGVFMLVVLLSMAAGVQHNFEQNLNSDSDASFAVWTWRTALPYNGQREGRNISFSDAELAKLRQECRHFIKDITYTVNVPSSDISTSTKSVSASPEGISPTEFASKKYKLIYGRALNRRDIDSNAKVMILSSDYARKLFPDHAQMGVGEYVKSGGLMYEVVGVYDHRWSRTVYVPLSTARLLTGNKTHITFFNIWLQNVHSEADGTRAENEIKASMSRLKGFAPADPSAVYLNNRFNQSLQRDTVMTTLNLGVWILGLLTLLTGIVGISNIMFVSVRERTHEIGIRRAIGARPHNIITQVIAEAISITLLFGYIGILLGMGVSAVIGMITKDSEVLLDPTISLGTACSLTAVLVCAGVLAGLFPAVRALKIKPVEALRDE